MTNNLSSRQFLFGESVEVTAGPASEPVTLQQAKDWLKVDTTADDDLITSLITAARQAAEDYTSTKLFTQTVVEKWDELPYSDAVTNKFGGISLSTWPVQSITSIQYVDDNGDAQTWAASQYIADTSAQPARIMPGYDKQWPTIRFQMAAFTVTYLAGYATVDDIPDTIKTAMQLMITDWYDNRTDSVRTMPMASQMLLKPYKHECYV